MVRVLGIDTSLRSTGFGVVEADGNRLRAIENGHLAMAARLRHSECLAGIGSGLDAIIARTQPDAIAIEGAFFFKNARTAMILGEARGAAICVCARHALPIFEYAPRRVKQAVVGFGGAGKEQVRKMVMTLLALRDEPQEDAGDALAVAICHLHTRTGIGMQNVVQV
jgi:crossover junction endodeoxyribonuclease RuvC